MRHFACFCYTYLDTETIKTTRGNVPRYVVRSSVLDFVEFNEPGTAENIKAWLERAL